MNLELALISKCKKNNQISGWFLRVTGPIQKKEYYRDRNGGEIRDTDSKTQIFPLETCGAYDHWKPIHDYGGNAYTLGLLIFV